MVLFIFLALLWPQLASAQSCPSGSTCYVSDQTTQTCTQQRCSYSGGGYGKYCCTSKATACAPGLTCNQGEINSSCVSQFCSYPNGGTGNWCCQTTTTNPSTPSVPTDAQSPAATTPDNKPTNLPATPPQDTTEFKETLKYPCSTTTPDEFHPLRPYPGSPCDPLIPKKSTLSFQCGPDLTPTEYIDFPPDGAGLPRCADGSGDVCVSQPVDYDVALDLSSASLPILGNTENPNLSDADKVNQYLAWYLNGVTPNSDYSPNRDPDRTLNFSGPLKKLLPLESQNAIRSEVVTGPVGKQYHNYIVGCREQFDVLKTFTDGVQSVFKSAALASQAWRIPRVINNLYQAYTSHPDQLATLVATNAQVLLSNETNFLRIESVYQQAGLDQFAEDYAAVASAGKSLLESLNNLINDYALQHAISCTKSNDIQRLTDFRDNLPPDPQKYSSFGKYWHDYVNWLGSANLPFGLGSINVPWLPDFWAELFQNIPFSSLEDTVGEATISLPSASSQEIINPKLTIKKADSRLYFPHLKSVNALSTILANIFRPQPQPVSLSQEIAEHQGLDDFTLVQNKTTKNTEIRDNQPAPGPLYVSGQCDISDVRLLPAGDSLYGQQITARLAYTQKFRYTPTSGLPSGARCLPSNPNACQSKKCQQTGEDSESYKCTDPEPVRLPTTGRVSVFTKTPLIKNIYSTLISAPDSLLKRFVSQDSQSEIKPIESAVPAASGPLFFSGIGSLFDQLLGSSLANLNLQRLLRPLSTSISSPPLSPTGTCTDAAKPSTAACQTPAGPVRLYKSYCFASTEAQKLIENAAAWAGIPPEILGAILSIEGVKSSNELFRFSNADIIKYSQNGSYDPFYCSPNQCGAMGPAQILTDLGVQPSCSQAAGNNEWAKFGDAVVRACVAPSGYAPNPANLRDNVYAAALLIKDKSNTVSANSRNWSKALVYETARRYYGSCAPLPHSRLADLKEANFCLSPNLPEYSVPPLGYCDYVWYYYSRREYGSVNLTPAPSPSDTALPNPRHPTPQ